MFHEFIQATLKGDKDTITRLAEQQFADKVIGNLDNIKKHNLSFERGPGLCSHLVREDEGYYGNLRKNMISDNKEDYIIDQVLIKGLSTTRSENS